VSALARFRRHPGLSLRKTTRRLTKTVRRHLSVVLRLLVRAIAASAVFLGATAVQAEPLQFAPKPAMLSTDWLPVTGTTDYTNPLFVYGPSVVRAGRYSVFWMLSSDTANDVSIKSIVVIDCEGDQMAFTESYGYRGTVASGHPIVANILPGSWQPIAPETVGDGFMHVVCGG
jgi:hypothetical protein